MADDLTSALTGLNYTPADTGYGIAQMGLNTLTPQLITPYTSTGKAVGIGLGSILLQSLLGYQARQEASRSTLELNTLANKMMTLGTPQARTDLIGSVADTGYQGRLSDLATALTAQEAVRKAKIDQAIAEKEAAAKFELGDTGMSLANEEIRREAAKAVAKNRALIAALGAGVKGTGRAAAQEAATGALPPTTYENELQAKRDALIMRAKEMGMTANQANTYADKVLAPQMAAVKKSQATINESRDRANKLLQVTTTARAGVEGAGMTGGALGPIREKASQLYAAVSPSEQEQRNYQAILDSVRPQIVNMLRSPGAVTDFETKLLMGAGPSSTNTPGENKALIQGMEAIAGLEADYADFMENYIAQKGTSVGGDAVWRQYKDEQAFPTGTYNPRRLDVQSWLAEKAGSIPQTGLEVVTPFANPTGETEAQKRNAELKARLQALQDKLAQRGK